MSTECKNLFFLRLGVFASIICGLFFCVMLVGADDTSVDKILESQSELIDHLKEQLLWLKIGCGGVITTLCTVVAILYRVTQKQQNAIVHEVKNSVKIKEEIMIRFAEMHQENLTNSIQNREESREMRESLKPLIVAINKLPCVDKKYIFDEHNNDNRSEG